MNDNVYPSVLSNTNNSNYTRVFYLECNCQYTEEVTSSDFVVVSTKYSNGTYNKEVFSRYKGFHNVGDKLKDGLYESLKKITKSKSLVDLVNEQGDQINIDSNKELLNEIFDSNTIVLNSLNNYNAPKVLNSGNKFTEYDIYVSQVNGKINNLEVALKKLLEVVSNMNQHMEKLEKDNQNLKSLVSQVLNHEVPEEMAKNILEDVFREML